MKRFTTRHVRFSVLTGLLIMFAMVQGALGQDEKGVDYKRLGQKIARLAKDPPGRAVAGIYVMDVTNGQEIFAQDADKQMNPASNVKIVTAAAALKLLGPEYRFETSLHGKIEGYAVRGPLFIKGHADPTLSTEHLWALAQSLRRQGVRRIEGGIVVDDTYFDAENMPFAYDQQPSEDAAFRAPVGAVSLNHNTIAVTIAPSGSAMKPARVLLDPPEYAVVTNDTLTIGSGAHNPKISSQEYTDRTKIRVWGQIPLGSRPVTYYKRVDNPSLLSGYGLKGVLSSVGIHVGGGVQVGQLPPSVPKIAEHLSEPLSQILWETGKMSNNFVTETVLKTMGAQSAEGPGTWAAAIKAVSGVLTEWQIPEGAYTYRNGSGLFDANRFSARQFVTVLSKTYLDSTVRPEFVAQLATGGVDGTIRSRYQGSQSKRLVRAKTGTLDSVSALTGFVFNQAGTRVIAFSILVNNASGYVSSSRAYQEKIVTEIARALN